MKKKTLRNQLFLKKETIVNLERPDMARAKGGCGEETIAFTCDPTVCTKGGTSRDSISTCYDTSVIPTQNP